MHLVVHACVSERQGCELAQIMEMKIVDAGNLEHWPNIRGVISSTRLVDCGGPGRGAYGLRRDSDARHGEGGGTEEVPGPTRAFHHEPQNPMTLSGFSGAAGGAVTPPTAIKASAR